MKKMKARSTIEKELRKCRRIFAIRSTGLGEGQFENELYGVQQALSWALGEDSMPPVSAAECTKKETNKCKTCKRNIK